MGARFFDDELTQITSQDGADQHFAPNINILDIFACNPFDCGFSFLFTLGSK